MSRTISFGENNLENKSMSNSTNGHVNSFEKLKWIVIILSLVTIIAIGFAFYFYRQQGAASSGVNPDVARQQQIQAEETKRYMEKLKAILLIDSNDSPIIAKVNDAEKLKKDNVEFYKNVQAGDLVYIYPQRVIIYRESENKIINIAPVLSVSDLVKDQQKKQEANSSKTVESKK